MNEDKTGIEMIVFCLYTQHVSDNLSASSVQFVDNSKQFICAKWNQSLYACIIFLVSHDFHFWHYELIFVLIFVNW